MLPGHKAQGFKQPLRMTYTTLSKRKFFSAIEY